MIRRPPRSTPLYSSAASDVYKRQSQNGGFAGSSHLHSSRCFEKRLDCNDSSNSAFASIKAQIRNFQISVSLAGSLSRETHCQQISTHCHQISTHCHQISTHCRKYRKQPKHARVSGILPKTTKTHESEAGFNQNSQNTQESATFSQKRPKHARVSDILPKTTKTRESEGHSPKIDQNTRE